MKLTADPVLPIMNLALLCCVAPRRALNREGISRCRMRFTSLSVLDRRYAYRSAVLYRSPLSCPMAAGM